MTSMRLAVSAIVLTGTLTPLAPALSGGFPGYARYVTEFGARCDGRTDDRAAIQSALNATRNGGYLVFPKGETCLIKGALKHHGSGWTIDGDGATIKMDGSVSGIVKRPPNWILKIWGANDWEMKNLDFDGNWQERRMPAPESGRQNSAHNLMIWNSKRFKIIDCNFYNSAQDGIGIGASGPNPSNKATASMDGLIRNVHVKNSWRIGLHIANAINIVVENSIFEDTEGDYPQAGIDVEANRRSYSPASEKLVFRDNLILNNKGYGLQISAVGAPRDIEVLNNLFSNNLRGGMQANATNVLVANNMFENTTRALNERYKNRTITTNGRIFLSNGSRSVDIENNAFDSIHAGRAVVFSRVGAGGHSLVGNCFADVSVPELFDRRGKFTTVRSNDFNAGRCADPR